MVRAQLERLDAEASAREALRGRLVRLLGALDGANGAAADLFLEAIEGMTMSERYYTPEQLAQLEQRRDALGDEGMRKAEADWAALIAEAEELRASGATPADPRARALADRSGGAGGAVHRRRPRAPRLAEHDVPDRGRAARVARRAVTGAVRVDGRGDGGAVGVRGGRHHARLRTGAAAPPRTAPPRSPRAGRRSSGYGTPLASQSFA